MSLIASIARAAEKLSPKSTERSANIQQGAAKIIQIAKEEEEEEDDDELTSTRCCLHTHSHSQRQQQQHRQQQQQQHVEQEEEQRENRKILDYSVSRLTKRNSSRQQTSKKSHRVVHHNRASSSSISSPCHLLVEQILHKVNELEHTLFEDQQQDFKLRMALERQTERVNDLTFSLDTEKQRNLRLVQLIRGVETTSDSEDDAENIECNQWPSRAPIDAYDSISPLLMQQRYDELSTSYKQSRRQLAKKDKQLRLVKCEKEELQAKYDYLLDEYRVEQKRFEDLCAKYMRLQSRKKQEILKLRDALSYASDCVLSAQKILDSEDNASDSGRCDDKEFCQNLQYFIKALRHCEWVNASAASSSRI